MNNKHFLISLWLLLIGLGSSFFYACDTLDPIEDLDNGDNNIVENTLPSDYFPTHEGAEWVYQYANRSEDGLFHEANYRKTITALGDSLFNDMLYAVIGQEEQDYYYYNRYIRKDGSQYIEYFPYYFFNQQDDNDRERIILDSSKEIGESWEYLLGEGQRKAKTVYTITDKIPRKVIDGIVYKGIIEVETTYWYFDQENQEFRYYEYYTIKNTYANHIGPLHLEEHVMSCGIFVDKYDLVEFQ